MAEKTPHRLFDYFTLEAYEQLAILEEEAARESQPDAGKFIAAARRFTSSAEMARLTGLAEISSGIERIALDVIRNQIPWTPELREAVIGGLRELRVSVSKVKDLDEDDFERLRKQSREVMKFTTAEMPVHTIIPISKLFYDDKGPHIVQLAAEHPDPESPKARGQALKDLLDASIARLGGSPKQEDQPAQPTGPVVPVEQLLYRGRAALDRAREIGFMARVQKRQPAPEELNELYDLIDLASTEAP